MKYVFCLNRITYDQFTCKMINVGKSLNDYHYVRNISSLQELPSIPNPIFLGSFKNRADYDEMVQQIRECGYEGKIPSNILTIPTPPNDGWTREYGASTANGTNPYHVWFSDEVPTIDDRPIDYTLGGLVPESSTAYLTRMSANGIAIGSGASASTGNSVAIGDWGDPYGIRGLLAAREAEARAMVRSEFEEQEMRERFSSTDPAYFDRPIRSQQEQINTLYNQISDNISLMEQSSILDTADENEETSLESVTIEQVLFNTDNIAILSSRGYWSIYDIHGNFLSTLYVPDGTVYAIRDIPNAYIAKLRS